MTQQYVGTKIVEARPKTRGDYVDFRGWALPEDEIAADEGYLITYHDGYITWSPKAVFEAGYISCGNIAHLPPHQQRVVAELVALDDRLDKLQRFFSTDMFNGLDAPEQTRMRMQANAMAQYSQCLADRIGAFGHEL